MLVGPDHAGNLYEIGVVDSEKGPVIPRHACSRQVPEVIGVPRSIEEILERADELAARFEDHEPQRGQIADADALHQVREAFRNRAAAEQSLATAVVTARTAGHSWAAIGTMLGTSGEAARQRYGQAAKTRAKTR